ncbi:MAG: sugar-binding transcriptional regulator [Microbacteriaceae bacterium]
MPDLEQHRARTAVSLEAAMVARRYYIDDKQKNEIADEFGISRFKVARLLDEARASGIVRIYVDMPSEIDLPLGEKVAQKYGIRRVIVVRTFDDDSDSIASITGAAAAQYLMGIVGPNDVLGISWGRSLTYAVDAVSARSATDVVQLVGGVRAGELDISGVELVRRLSEKTGGNAYPLHAPLLVRTPAMAKELRDDPSLADAIGRFASLTVAAVGIGSWHPPKSSLFTAFTPEERTELAGLGATADLCAIVLDSDGTPVQSPAIDRAVGITMNELRAVPEVIAIAGGSDKVAAIIAVLKSGAVHTLVTDSQTASHLLD